MMLSVAGGVVLGLMVFNLMSYGFQPFKRDDSDPVDGRSGFMVLTDDLTGVQYLVTTLGGLTPRLREDGTVMVRARAK